MNKLIETQIDGLLLSFSALNNEQQDRFLDRLNLYIFASPRQRQQLRVQWKAPHRPDEQATSG